MNILKKVGRLFDKGVYALKTRGFWATLKAAVRFVYFKLVYIVMKLLGKGIYGLAKQINMKNVTNVIVFENNLGWNRVMKQRPQQIAENLPENTIMFYHSHDSQDFKGSSRINVLKNNLVIIDLGYYRNDLMCLVAGIKNKFLMVYSTDYIPVERIDLYERYGYKTLYEYVDDINPELSGESYPLLLEVYNKIITDDNAYVVTTATNLKNKIEAAGKEAHLATNGVVYEHFEYNDYAVPEDLAPILNKGKTTLCYYGALASWFDYELARKIAQSDLYSLVLIGLNYDGTLEKSGILELPNVYYLGKKAYEELPRYGCNVDICIIPFVINDITEATSPVKLFEYMAMAKPIVTTALPECKKYESVLYSACHEEFMENLKKASLLKSDENYKALLKKEALENTWSSKANSMVDYMVEERERQVRNVIFDTIKAENYQRIIIWRSPFGWDVPLYQRPQHIDKQFSEQGCLVLYEVSIATDHVIDVKKQFDNLILVNFENLEVSDYVYEALALTDKPKYIQIYSTNWSMDIGELEYYRKNGFKILYEYIDDISPELAGTKHIPQQILDKYNYVMSNKDVPVVTTATRIHEDVLSKRGEENVVLAGNGVDYAFFSQIEEDFPFEDEFTNIVNNGKINLCYYGALAKWFDYDIIKEINATNKYNIILFGAKYDNAFDKSGIIELENVYFLGSRSYSILKNYAAKMDILMIPFLINSITQATSPVKIFEYMALKKPIVTTAMQECMKYESVIIANSKEEFVPCLSKAYELKDSKEYQDLLKKEAIENDWSVKAKTIIELLKKNEG